MRRLSISPHIEFGRDPDDDRDDEVQTIPAHTERADTWPDEHAELDARPIGFRATRESQ
jgi:hypothetical protein